MEAQWYPEILACGPNGIVVGLVNVRNISEGHRNRWVHHSLMSLGNAPLDLVYRGLHRRDRYDTLGDKAFAHTGPLLN